MYDGQWWVLLATVTALVLICYGAVLRIQLFHSRGERQEVLVAMRFAFAALPATFFFLVLAFVPLLPPMLWLATHGFDLVGALFLLAALAGMVMMFFGWPAIVAQSQSPLAAARRSVLLARLHYGQLVLLVALLIAAIVIFALLASIFIGAVVMLAGPTAQSNPNWLALSRWLMAAFLAIPIVYVSAVSITAWRCATQPTVGSV